MKQFVSVASLVAVTGLGASGASAQITIPTVSVGNPGNASDTRVMNDGTSGYGSVAYSYNIGTYEVTAGQYASFLNAVAANDTNGLYNLNMDRSINPSLGCGITRSGFGTSFTYTVDAAFVNRPVTYVSFWNATRFANWLHNGQPTGPQSASTTEDGAYTLTAFGIGTNTITRNTTWRWAVTSEDEWYKAAYYKGGNTNAGYWLYPTKNSTAPGNNLADPSGNNANYYTGAGPYPIDPPYFTTPAGQFQNSASPYGTFDQGGNVSEWNEAIILRSIRGVRGGGFNTGGYDYELRADVRNGFSSDFESFYLGFRVSQIPGPSPFFLLTIGGLAVVRRRRTTTAEHF